MIAVLLACGGLATVASPALALNAVVANCNNNGHRLTRRYSSTQLQQALNAIPPDLREYTQCASVIQNQLYKQVSVTTGIKGNTSGGSGSSFPIVPVIIVVVVVALGGGLALRSYRRSSGGGGPKPPTTES
jgi:hypothetical protein